MFSFLDGINSWLSYINIEPKTKSRLYVILGFLGELYLIYISYRFLTNGVIVRGSLFLLVTIVLAYFLYLNAIYYFLNRNSKIDLTPKLYQLLHINPKSATDTPPTQYRNIPANGLFDDRETMPATLVSNPAQQAFINQLAIALENEQLLQKNYGGTTDRELTRQLKHGTTKTVSAIGKGVLIPYFSLENQPDGYQVRAGINAAQADVIGKIETVGLQSVTQLDRQRGKLYLAGAYLTGGKYKMLGRNGLMENNDDYHVELQVAYQQPSSSPMK
ncbi:hypothetical protein B808_258 [Fructilactobacillus florum 8D]|uniref:Uncharacterized protein n=2 Tax=Fructilactobacillus florum TaxID=640331 RepID=W9EIF8_9LACO|nr:DUF6681 family protein [Fructilactobacillus florum]ETO40800.1 hypothetical protein B808_258 [Fructilactobacillus florum 8D]KRM90542.1 hypothetical protein FC87_GL001228 [Fructilactobacillus florum DSM 22689 = JCM 16035]